VQDTVRLCRLACSENLLREARTIGRRVPVGRGGLYAEVQPLLLKSDDELKKKEKKKKKGVYLRRRVD